MCRAVSHRCLRSLALATASLVLGFLPGGVTRSLGQQANATVQFASRFNTANETSGSATIPVTRSGNTDSTITVDYIANKGSATAGSDYTPQSGTLSFVSGEISKTFSIPILDDPVAEGSETIELILTNPSAGAVLGAQATARLFILDNENRGTLLDTTFGAAIGPSDLVNAIVLQPDGKVVVAGSFARSGSATPDRVIRLNSDGSRDASFAAPDGGPNNNVLAVALQPDGRIIIAGEFTQVGPITRNRISRFNPDGSLDRSFDSGSGVTGNISPAVYTVALQRDGKVLIGGNFDTVDGIVRNTIARLNTNGSLDATFDPGRGVSSTDPNFRVPWVSAIAAQGGDKVLIGGQFTDVGGIDRRNLARLNSDGTVDTSFDPGSGATGNLASVEALAVQPDGKVIVGGDFTSVNAVGRSAIARLHADGSFDQSFDPGTGVRDTDANGADTVGLVTSLAAGTDGKVLFGGRFLTFDDINRHGLARLNSDGSLDGSFGPFFGTTYRTELGYEELDSVTALAVQPDGRVLIGGTFVSANGSRTNRLTRLLSTNVRTTSFEFLTPSTSTGESSGPVSVTVIRRGDSDKSFTVEFAMTGGTATAGMDYLSRTGTLEFAPLEVEKTIAVSILDDGKIEEDETFNVFLRNPSTGSTLGSPENHVVRIVDSKKPGNLDFGFTEVAIPFPNNPTAFLPVTAIALQSDAKVVVSGHFVSVNGTNRAGLVRLNVDGSIDPTFVPQPPPGAQVLDFHQMGLQPDGSIIGGFNGAYRLNPDGSLDTRFNPDVGDVNALTVQSDGKFLISDEFFDPIAGVTVNEVSRFLANGRFDTSFRPAVLDDWVNAIAAQPDGKIVIGGYFTQVNGVAINRIARLNVDGSLDDNFTVGSGIQGSTNASVFALALEADGKLIIGGDFNTVDKISRNNIVRLNPDASADLGFDPGTGPNNFVDSLAVQPDGKVLIGGSFTSVAGVLRFGLARLNRDGSLDTNFEPKLAFPGAVEVSSIAIQADGKILIGGLFSAVNGAPRAGVARLIGDANFLKLNLEAPKPKKLFRLSLTSRPGKQYRIDASPDLVNWMPISTNIATGFTLEFEDPTADAAPGRFYRAILADP